MSSPSDSTSTSGLPPPPGPGLYFIRTMHSTYVSLRHDLGNATTMVYAGAVGNFERIEVAYATSHEVVEFMAYKNKQQAVAGAKMSAPDVVQRPIPNNNSMGGVSGGTPFCVAEEDGGKLYPLVTLKSVPTGCYLGLTAGGGAVQQVAPTASGAAGPQEVFSLRPHTRLRPLGVHWLLYNEAFGVNIEALPPPTPGGDDEGADVVELLAKPTAAAQLSGVHAYRGSVSASPWCGLEFIAVDDIYTRPTKEAAFAARGGEANAAVATSTTNTSELTGGEDETNTTNGSPLVSAETMAKLFKHMSAVTPRVPLQQLQSGIYVLSARSTNARLAIIGGGDGTNGFRVVAATDICHADDTKLRVIDRVTNGKTKTQFWGKKVTNNYSIGNPLNGLVGGLEKKQFHTRTEANAWEEWEILPHPSIPLHHCIRNIAFDKYICVDPSVKLSDGMVLRTSDKPGAWEAFYVGDAAALALLD